MDINCLLFDGFESLDLFGPVEVLSGLENAALRYFSIDGGIVTSSQNTRIVTESSAIMNPGGLLLLPGGRGTRTLVNDAPFIEKLKNIAEKAAWCLTVCTGSGLLAKTGLLDNRRATSNKMAFEWAKNTGKDTLWVYRARWTTDGKFYTSSGVAAGIDMSLGFVRDQYGQDKAETISKRIEYSWNSDMENDPFAV